MPDIDGYFTRVLAFSLPGNPGLQEVMAWRGPGNFGLHLPGVMA